MIIEYKLHPVSINGRKTMKIPDFVTDGGYWGNPDDHTLIGSIPDSAEYYVPDSVVVLTPTELGERQLAIHAKYPIKIDDRVLADDEIKTMIADWVSARS
tara:strand:- start:46 stop:345 length:300 start_codon:yes stop_codon:yes gene_type:complete